MGAPRPCPAPPAGVDRAGRGRRGATLPDWLWTSFALLLMVEGLLPFVAPRLWRDTFRKLTEMSDGQIRFVGLTSLLLGVVALAFLDHA